MEDELLKELLNSNNYEDNFIWILLLLAIVDGCFEKEPTTINIYLGDE